MNIGGRFVSLVRFEIVTSLWVLHFISMIRFSWLLPPIYQIFYRLLLGDDKIE